MPSPTAETPDQQQHSTLATPWRWQSALSRGSAGWGGPGNVMSVRIYYKSRAAYGSGAMDQERGDDDVEDADDEEDGHGDVHNYRG